MNQVLYLFYSFSAFFRDKDVQTHIARVHTAKPTDVLCSFCQQAFSTKFSALRHEKYHCQQRLEQWAGLGVEAVDHGRSDGSDKYPRQQQLRQRAGSVVRVKEHGNSDGGGSSVGAEQLMYKGWNGSVNYGIDKNNINKGTRNVVGKGTLGTEVVDSRSVGTDYLIIRNKCLETHGNICQNGEPDASQVVGIVVKNDDMMYIDRNCITAEKFHTSSGTMNMIQNKGDDVIEAPVGSRGNERLPLPGDKNDSVRKIRIVSKGEDTQQDKNTRVANNEDLLLKNVDTETDVQSSATESENLKDTLKENTVSMAGGEELGHGGAENGDLGTAAGTCGLQEEQTCFVEIYDNSSIPVQTCEDVSISNVSEPVCKLSELTNGSEAVMHLGPIRMLGLNSNKFEPTVERTGNVIKTVQLDCSGRIQFVIEVQNEDEMENVVKQINAQISNNNDSCGVQIPVISDKDMV